MAIDIDYEVARAQLEELFHEAENTSIHHSPPDVDEAIIQVADRVFSSGSRSYREALLGCGLAKWMNPSINIRHPYASQSDDAFNGRTLDERVINPFFREKSIPCSTGPYLNVFRRSVSYEPETARGLRDKSGFDAMLKFIDALENADRDTCRRLVVYLLYRFIVLRDESEIRLDQINRLSVPQYDALVDCLLQVRSGGLIPVLLTVAVLKTLNQCFGLSWDIAWQGINVADRARGAGGDITVRKEEKVIFVLEVTEREISRERVTTTFITKIAPAGISDYLFIYSDLVPGDEAKKQAYSYFAQGHEINFLSLRDWLIHTLATVGADCRQYWIREMLDLLTDQTVSANIKISWNNCVQHVVEAGFANS